MIPLKMFSVTLLSLYIMELFAFFSWTYLACDHLYVFIVFLWRHVNIKIFLAPALVPKAFSSPPPLVLVPQLLPTVRGLPVSPGELA